VSFGLAVVGVQVILGILRGLFAAPTLTAADALWQLTTWGIVSFIACGCLFFLAAYRHPLKAWQNMVGMLVLYTLVGFVLEKLLMTPTGPPTWISAAFEWFFLIAAAAIGTPAGFVAARRTAARRAPSGA
jgi:hypothetical protein